MGTWDMSLMMARLPPDSGTASTRARSISRQRSRADSPVTETGATPAGQHETGPGIRDGRALPDDQARTEMMRRTAALPLRERIALFEALSRDAAWARSATRIR